MAYHAPALRDPEKDWQPYALQILSGILDGNASARLNKILVREKQLASNVGAGYDATSRGPSLFVLEGTPSEGKSCDRDGRGFARANSNFETRRRERR